MQAKLKRSVARLYPIEMGKGWIASLLKDRNIPDGELVQTSEGVRLRTRPDYLFKHAYLFREFEPVITAVFKRVVEPGDVCFDVGASFGFYTCLFAMRGARVYAFEPMPASFALNQEAVQLNGCGAKIKAYNSALGSEEGTTRIHTFKVGRPLGGVGGFASSSDDSLAVFEVVTAANGARDSGEGTTVVTPVSAPPLACMGNAIPCPFSLA